MITKMPLFTIRQVGDKWEARISDQAVAEIKGYERYGTVTAATPEAAYWKIRCCFEDARRYSSSNYNYKGAEDCLNTTMEIRALKVALQESEKESKRYECYAKYMMAMLLGLAVFQLIF